MSIPATVYYGNQKLIDRFKNKSRSAFFRSETMLLDSISIETLKSVLDIGCAAARFLDLLHDYGFTGTYTGIDAVAENLRNASQLYPDATFVEGDVLQMTPPARFDLVNATGILQNEPRYAALLDWMLTASARYVMFDLKVADIERTLYDPETVYCEWDGLRLPMVCLSEADFRVMLSSLAKVGQVRFLRYPTPFNAETVVPSWLMGWYSVGVLVDLASFGTDDGTIVELAVA